MWVQCGSGVWLGQLGLAELENAGGADYAALTSRASIRSWRVRGSRRMPEPEQNDEPETGADNAVVGMDVEATDTLHPNGFAQKVPQPAGTVADATRRMASDHCLLDAPHAVRQQPTYRSAPTKGTTREQNGMLRRRVLRRRMSVVQDMSDGDVPLCSMLARAVDEHERAKQLNDENLVPKVIAPPAGSAPPNLRLSVEHKTLAAQCDLPVRNHPSVDKRSSFSCCCGLDSLVRRRGVGTRTARP